MKRIFTTLFFALFFAVGTFGQDVQTSFASGTKLAAAGQFETALAQFTTAAKLADATNTSADKRAQLEYNIAVCHFRLGRIDEAVAKFESAIRLRPMYEKAFYALGMAEAERQNWLDAEKAFLGTIAINQQNAEAWFDLGYVYLAQKDSAGAKAAFELSAKYKSIDAAVSRNNIGVILASYGDTRGAIAEFEQALRLSGNKLKVARKNLEICHQREIMEGKMVAVTLEFGKWKLAY